MKIFFAVLMLCPVSLLFGQTFILDMYEGLGLVDVSSGLSESSGDYPAANLLDGTWRSWAEGKAGNGVGEYFTLGQAYNGDGNGGYHIWKDESGLNDFTAAGFALKNGYGNPDYYSKNNRVKSFKIYADGKYIETIAIKDSINFEQYAFSKPITCKKIRFIIDSVYPGSNFDDTCIEEITLLGKIISDKEFYKNILFALGGPGADGPGWGYYRSHEDTVYTYNYETGESRRIDNNIPYVNDVDEDTMLLKRYLPFAVKGGEEYGLASEIALLDKPSSLQLTENLPRLDGATAMYPLYSAFVHAVYPEEQPEFGDDDYHSGVFNDWKYKPNMAISSVGWESRNEYWSTGEPSESIVQCNKTPAAYERLINGNTDIIFCYEPSQTQIAAAKAKGLQFNLSPIAKDAFVFIVNEKNPLKDLTTNQIQNIYSGKITNWKSITGIDEPILAYQRPENSGSQSILQVIMNGAEIMPPILDSRSVPRAMFDLIESISSTYYNYRAAIGYTFLFYLNTMAGNAGTKVLSLDGVAPNQLTIQNGRYPYTQTVYAVTVGNESVNTKKFIDWITSEQGQELVEKTGYVPIR